jgi:glycosyltransferase involved in cell wall biosynthesis
MKIVLFVKDLNIGGVTKVVVNHVNNVIRVDDEVLILNWTGENTGITDNTFKGNVVVHNLCFPWRTYSIYRLNSFYAKKIETRLINKVLLNFEPNIIHFHFTYLAWTSTFLYSKKTRRIMTFHCEVFGENENIISILLKKTLFYFFNRNTLFHFVSEVNNSFGNKRRYNTITFGNAVGFNVFKKIKSVIYISRINHLKGHFFLLNAWKNLSIKNYKLKLIGPDETGGEIVDFIKKNNIKNVELIGPVQDINPYLVNASFGIFPSLKEGSPVALLEMLAAKLIVISSDIPEIKKVIPRDCLIYYNSEDLTELEKKILYVIKHKDELEEIANNGLKLVTKNYSFQVHRDIYQKLYNY